MTRRMRCFPGTNARHTARCGSPKLEERMPFTRIARLRAAVLIVAVMSITDPTAASERPGIQLITLDPGHFHASLVQKFMYPGIDPNVHVYAPAGDDLDEHLKRIERFNTRVDQ